ncbi:Hypothetical predicted protein, partial [Olea europaea subsp. europaea]
VRLVLPPPWPLAEAIVSAGTRPGWAGARRARVQTWPQEFSRSRPAGRAACKFSHHRRTGAPLRLHLRNLRSDVSALAGRGGASDKWQWPRLTREKLGIAAVVRESPESAGRSADCSRGLSLFPPLSRPAGLEGALAPGGPAANAQGLPSRASHPHFLIRIQMGLPRRRRWRLAPLNGPSVPSIPPRTSTSCRRASWPIAHELRVSNFEVRTNERRIAGTHTYLRPAIVAICSWPARVLLVQARRGRCRWMTGRPASQPVASTTQHQHQQGGGGESSSILVFVPSLSLAR